MLRLVTTHPKARPHISFARGHLSAFLSATLECVDAASMHALSACLGYVCTALDLVSKAGEGISAGQVWPRTGNYFSVDSDAAICSPSVPQKKVLPTWVAAKKT